MLQEIQLVEPTWLLMVGHYPIFSAGEHGDSSELVNNLLPIIDEFNVDCYFSGHDHISEHLKFGKTHYFVAGAGSMSGSLGNTNSEAELLWSGTGYSAYLSVEASHTSLSFKYLDKSNEEQYSYQLKKRTVEDRSKPTEPNSSWVVYAFIYSAVVLAFIGMFILVQVTTNNPVYNCYNGIKTDEYDLNSSDEKSDYNDDIDECTDELPLSELSCSFQYDINNAVYEQDVAYSMLKNQENSAKDMKHKSSKSFEITDSHPKTASAGHRRYITSFL